MSTTDPAVDYAATPRLSFPLSPAPPLKSPGLDESDLMLEALLPEFKELERSLGPVDSVSTVTRATHLESEAERLGPWAQHSTSVLERGGPNESEETPEKEQKQPPEKEQELQGGTRTSAEPQTAADDNEFAAAFQRSLTAYGVVLTIASCACLVIFCLHASQIWAQKPSWMARVPPCLAPQLEPLATTSTRIKRYLVITDIAPPTATLLLLCLHFWKHRASSPRVWRPPSALSLAAIWGWLALAPLLVYICVNVQSPQFVDYDAISISICELAASAALFPPVAHELANSTARTMRAAAKGYFTQKHNLLFPELDFERELAGIPTDLTSETEGGGVRGAYGLIWGETGGLWAGSTCSFLSPRGGLAGEGKRGGVGGGQRREARAVEGYCSKAVAAGKKLGHSRLAAGSCRF